MMRLELCPTEPRQSRAPSQVFFQQWLLAYRKQQKIYRMTQVKFMEIWNHILVKNSDDFMEQNDNRASSKS